MDKQLQQGKDAPILVTGSAGFIGKNLCARLRAAGYTQLLPYDLGTPLSTLEEYTQKAAFVFHLAGINRPENPQEFYTGNAGLTEQLTALLAKQQNPAPVLLSSSAQAGNGTDYAKSKQQAEDCVFAHGKACGTPVFVFRLPGVFGKWCRPSYNSVVATFCHKLACGEEIEVREESFVLPLCYIDDVVNRFIEVLEGEPKQKCEDGFCEMWPQYEVSLGQLAATVRSFVSGRANRELPCLSDAFTRKLYATFLSYLPREGFALPLDPKRDERGSFTEFLRTPERGQISINVAKPGVTKGNHWHDTKHEIFYVVSGQGVIRFRKLGETEVFDYLVDGETPKPVVIPPGYTHNIQNLGENDLVTVMWASEAFNPQHPDTYFEEV